MSLDDLIAGDLKLKVDASDGEQISVHWEGKANQRQPLEVLGPFFDQLMDFASESGRSIRFHFLCRRRCHGIVEIGLERI